MKRKLILLVLSWCTGAYAMEESVPLEGWDAVDLSADEPLLGSPRLSQSPLSPLFGGGGDSGYDGGGGSGDGSTIMLSQSSHAVVSSNVESVIFSNEAVYPNAMNYDYLDEFRSRSRVALAGLLFLLSCATDASKLAERLGSGSSWDAQADESEYEPLIPCPGTEWYS